ncbi:Sulfate/thiosulfate import ATP-binding protein CysA [Halomonadaceae bacterium LMG 33818]|uniref:sulfate/molybdate ABC transporter ATP-binding protein n=1 Tax=Cernens ardua TaxID=3402176 RepID=UPI003EDBAE96
MSITVDQVARHYGRTTALQSSSLKIHEGEMVGLLGPSGSGKTTLLRIIAGLETPSQGRITFGDKEVTHLHPRYRRVGFMFQDYALFKHMNVFENIAFGLKARPRKHRPSAHEIKQQVNELLERMQLTPFAKRLPAQLSGGQQQRVALARALAIKPDVLLMDEPFGALDAKVRIELRRWLKQLHQELGFTCIFVTHDQEEALELSDRVVVMSQGRIEQIASPDELYRAPKNRFVYDFLGASNSLKGELRANRLQVNKELALQVESTAVESTADSDVELLCRPYDVALAREPIVGHSLPFRISTITHVGPAVDVELSASWSDAHWHAALSHLDLIKEGWTVGDRCHGIPHTLFRVGEKGQLHQLDIASA